MSYRTTRPVARALSTVALLASLAALHADRALAASSGEQCPAVPSMNDIANVAVEARRPSVEQSEAFNDCCVFCEEQSLEALTPTASGPQFLEPDGGLPLRTKFCGKVVRYGVLDELEDPRDIMLNIEAAPGFEHFLEGYLNTECTPLDDPGIFFEHPFEKWDSSCPVTECRAAAKKANTPPPNSPKKCIHAEITPAQQFYREDARFLPIGFQPIVGGGTCDDSWGCNSALEPAADWAGGIPPGGQPGQDGRQVCVYGVYAHDHGSDHRAEDHRELCCSPDTGHDRPEIHPSDALWFLHPDGKPGWVFGTFQDDSNRYSFPHCGDQHNGNTWSQAPRDLTFRFPFSLPRTPALSKACLRHFRTTDFSGTIRDVLPINVTTAAMEDPLFEVKTLTDGSQVVLEVIEQEGAEDETQVRIEGCVTASEISGWVTVRVAVGCPEGVSCPQLKDPEDPGSGFYYGELSFERDCSR